MFRMNEDKYFKLFANCIPVKGAKRSVICDLQREDFNFIPNGLYDILMDFKSSSIKQLKNSFAEEEHETIDEYFNFLIEKNLGFFCNRHELDLFPKMDLFWDEPFQITNAIIDNDSTSTHNYALVFKQLEDLGCGYVQLRFFSEITIAKIHSVLSLCDRSRIKSFELLLKYSEELSSYDTLKKLCANFPRIRTVFIHSSPKYIPKLDDSTMGNIIYATDIILSSSHCGIIDPAYFNIGMMLFSESQKYNTCLNRKISIDISGNIKNCPSMEKKFGNIKNTSLLDVLGHQNFKDLWTINKDQIEVCKDCEFRYICSDCRAFVNDAQNIYSKPLKCKYDPYSATWEN